MALAPPCWVPTCSGPISQLPSIPSGDSERVSHNSGRPRVLEPNSASPVVLPFAHLRPHLTSLSRPCGAEFWGACPTSLLRTTLKPPGLTLAASGPLHVLCYPGLNVAPTFTTVLLSLGESFSDSLALFPLPILLARQYPNVRYQKPPHTISHLFSLFAENLGDRERITDLATSSALATVLCPCV